MLFLTLTGILHEINLYYVCEKIYLTNLLYKGHNINNNLVFRNNCDKQTK